MKKTKGWTTTKLVTLGALAALNVILSLPGTLLAGMTGIYLFGAAVNFLSIGIGYSFIALLMKKTGSLTIWSTMFGILCIPLPIMGPPGFILKVVYSGLWGILGDIVYFIFKKSEILLAISIGIAELGTGIPLAVLFWNILGAGYLSVSYQSYLTPLTIIGGSLIGAALGICAYLLYKKIEKTSIVKRIQR